MARTNSSPDLSRPSTGILAVALTVLAAIAMPAPPPFAAEKELPPPRRFPSKIDPKTPVTALLPASLWGTLLARGEVDTFSFGGFRGQKVVIDAAAKRIGSKAELALTLTDAAGRLIASNIEFEGESDPLIVASLPADGKYLLTVTDLQLGASADHFYRLSVGDLPVVTGVFPLAIPAGAEADVRLVGANLPGDAGVKVKAGAPGEAAVPVDTARFRVRRPLKVLVSPFPERPRFSSNIPRQARTAAPPWSRPSGEARTRACASFSTVSMP